MANHTDLAEASSNTAPVAAYLASKQSPQSGAALHWRDALSRYQKALDIYIRIRARGALHAEHANEPRRLEREIERCSAALKKNS